jgi:hypothetical protein
MAMTDLSTPSVDVTAKTDEGSYLDWPAVLAGTVAAAAISLVLITFGSAIGLSLTSAHENTGISFAGFSIAAALWLVWVQVSGFMAGGYLTGRMRRRNYDATEYESDIRDGAHGLTVWGLGVLVGAVIAFSGATAAVSTATSAVSTIASGAASGAANALDEALSDGMVVDRLFRAPAQPAAPGAPADDTAEQREEIGRIFLSAVTSGKLEDADRQYIIQTVAARTGVPPEEVQQRVDQAWTQAQAIETQAREAADRARRIGVIAAFVTAASLLIGAVGAYFGAVMGGNHRDKQVVIEGWVKPW